MTLRIGLLGAGFLQDFHARAWREIPGIELAAVGSASEASAKAFASKWKIPRAIGGEDAIEQVCTMPDVDVVSIGIPNFLHEKAATLAAEHGKHVICEKPLGRNVVEAKAMLRAVEKAGVIHCYAENQVFFPLHQHAFETIKDGALGDVYWVRSREAHGGPHAEHFWNVEKSGGGVGLDMGCHCVEVARKAFGNDTPVEVMMWGDTLVHRDKTTGEDNCLIMVKFKHGQVGQAENSWSTRAGLDLRTEMHGTMGALFMDNTRETGIKVFSARGVDYAVEKGESTTGWMFPVPDEHVVYGYYHELKHFAGCIATGTMPVETFRDGVVVNAILDAGYASMREKRWAPVEV